MKSRAYKLDGKTFRYDYETGQVEYIYKADQETVKDEQEWIRDHGRPLYGIDEHGYIVAETVGLRAENWKNKAARDEYLSGWSFELDEEAAYLADQYMRYG